MRNKEVEARMAIVATMLARAVKAILPDGMRFCVIAVDPKHGAWGADGSGTHDECIHIARAVVQSYDGTLTDPSAPIEPTPDRSAN